MDTPSPRPHVIADPARHESVEAPASDDCRHGPADGIARFGDLVQALQRIQTALGDPRQTPAAAPAAWSDERYCYVEIPLDRLDIVEFDVSSSQERLFLRIARES